MVNAINGESAVLPPCNHRPNGQFSSGNRAASVDGKKRRALGEAVFRVVSVEKLEKALQNLLDIACDSQHPSMVIKAVDLISRLTGLQQQTLELISRGDSEGNPEDRVQALRFRLAEMLENQAAAMPAIANHE